MLKSNITNLKMIYLLKYIILIKFKKITMRVRFCFMDDQKMKRDARIVYSAMGILTVVFLVVLGIAVF
jgi:hypothetical protein